MPFNSIFSWLIGKRMARINECRENPFASQLSVFKYLISEGKTTEFGYKNTPTWYKLFWSLISQFGKNPKIGAESILYLISKTNEDKSKLQEI